MDFKKVGTDILVGAPVGVLDQIISNYDANRDATSPTPIGFGKQIGTYFNYGLPILAVVAAGAGWVRGDMATRLVTVGGAVAGRKITQKMTHMTMVKTASQWSRAARDSAARSAASRDASKYEVQNATEILV
ncbi:MAG: hypothetical protein WCY09_09560 [Candidatus Omnitrophota bacterium]|jgi:hypothetical protein